MKPVRTSLEEKCVRNEQSLDEIDILSVAVYNHFG